MSTHSPTMSSNIYNSNKSSLNPAVVEVALKRYYLPTMYAVIFAVGLLGNITAIGIYLAKLRPWKSNSIIMVNLASADLLYVLSLPFLVFYYGSGGKWTLGNFMCRLVRFGFYFNLYGSILFLTCLSVFRYVAVVHPHRVAHLQEKTWGIVACVAVWSIIAVEITPMLAIITVENQTCLDFASSNQVDVVWWYSWVLTVLGYLLPLVVVVVCYASIMWELAKGPFTKSPCKTRARRLTVLILVVFVVCFLPYHILRAMRIHTRNSMSEHLVNAAYIVSRPVAGLNSFFNLMLYTLAGENFQQAFISLLPWKAWKASAMTHLMDVNSRPSYTDSARSTAATDLATNKQ
ncbi:2-oxoglutarate receptor 1-like [Esox lucius]|uniref:G-protein coupled receptors family 1 profile domain-containing protein n=1 Tax=Esox lucius TaxID=8010 RepID=A0A3P8Z5A9_ESOLU|nr:2-oxoglutarate receptor 1-like [Esox lucius]